MSGAAFFKSAVIESLLGEKTLFSVSSPLSITRFVLAKPVTFIIGTLLLSLLAKAVAESKNATSKAIKTDKIFFMISHLSAIVT